jgi:hypothetical protein
VISESKVATEDEERRPQRRARTPPGLERLDVRGDVLHVGLR